METRRHEETKTKTSNRVYADERGFSFYLRRSQANLRLAIPFERDLQRAVMSQSFRVLTWYNPCYTHAMKTAVSLPDDLFRMAEAAARKLRMSRSQLYATAIAEFLERRKTSRITERLNKVYSKERSALDPAWHSAQLRSLAREDW
jgi:hypothetical protein